MLDLWKKQLTAARFSLHHDEPRIFIRTQWQKTPASNVWYLAYRICVTLFFTCTLILSIVDESNLDKPYMFRVKWLIYLTNWGFSLCTLQSCLCTFMLIKSFFLARKGNISQDENASVLYKVYWALNTIATDGAFAITTLYWIVIYDAATMPLDYVNIVVHGMNSVCMMVELLVVAHPVKITHFYLPFSFGAIYTVFSAVYYSCGGTSRDNGPNIYKVINWSKPLPTLLICIGAMIFLVVIHTLAYFIYRGRVWASNKIMKIDSNSENTQIPITETFKGVENAGMANEEV